MFWSPSQPLDHQVVLSPFKFGLCGRCAFKPRIEAAWANLKNETGKNDGKQPTNESTVTYRIRQNVANTSCSGQMRPKWLKASRMRQETGGIRKMNMKTEKNTKKTWKYKMYSKNYGKQAKLPKPHTWTSWNFVELRGTSCKRTFPLIFHVLGVFCQIAAWFTEIHCVDVRFCWFSYLWTIFAKLELDSLESNVKTCIPNCFK